MKKKNNKIEFKRWEVVLLTLAATLSVGSFVIFITGYPIRNYLFGLQEDSQQQAIGRVSSLSGGLKRETLGDSEFRIIQNNSAVFAQDTIVTGEDGKAIVALDDGSTIELGPKTMVRLQNEASFDFTGVQRTTRVELVSGQVSGTQANPKSKVMIRRGSEDVELSSRPILASADKPVIPAAQPRSEKPARGMLLSLFQKIPKETPPPPPQPEEVKPEPKPVTLAKAQNIPPPAPSPTPAPTVAPSPSPTPVVAMASPKPIPAPREDSTFELVSPPNGAMLAVNKGSPVAQRPIQLQWKISAAARGAARNRKLQARVRVSRLGSDGKLLPPELDQTFRVVGANSSVIFTAKSPGVYQWEVYRSDMPMGRKARFNLAREFEAIQLTQPEALRYRKVAGSDELRKPQVKLSWKPYPGASEYQLKIVGTNKAPIDTTVRDTSFMVTRADITDSERSYQVASTLPNGFVVRSSSDRFIFDFTPPDPVTPPNRTVLEPSEDLWTGNGVLMTWQKTGISEGYVLEISSDPTFKSVIVKREQKDNFFIYHPNKTVPEYWWRVRSYAKKATSRPSVPFVFHVANASAGVGAAPQQQPSPR